MISTDCNSCPFFELAVGPVECTKKSRFAASVPRPMQISGLGAVSSRSGPRIRDLCVERISLRRGERCTRPHEANRATRIGRNHLLRETTPSERSLGTDSRPPGCPPRSVSDAPSQDFFGPWGSRILHGQLQRQSGISATSLFRRNRVPGAISCR